MKSMLKNDIKIYHKYGFIYLYIVISLIYIAVIHILPSSIRATATLLIVFTDPAVLGLYFMGAIILYEKSEKVINYISITPISIDKYIFSKIISLSFISVISGLSIFLFSGVTFNFLLVTLTLFLGSMFFSLCGLMAASRIKSLNQFIIYTIPFQILLTIPASLYALKLLPDYTLFYPTIALISLLSSDTYLAFPLFLLFLGWSALLYYIVRLSVIKMFKELGGIKL